MESGKPSEPESNDRLFRDMVYNFIESATDGIYILDAHLNFLELNKRALEIVGLKKEDVIGKNIADIVPDVKTSGRYEKHLEVISTGKPYVIDHFIPHPRFGNMHFVLKSFKVGDGLGVIAHDITERKRMEEEILTAQKLESLGILAGGIAHDFNNLLGGIFGFIDLARATTKEPEVAGYLDKTLSAVQRAKGLTQQLLTFAKGGVPVKKTERFSPFIQEAVQFALSGSHGGCIEVESEPGAGSTFHVYIPASPTGVSETVTTEIAPPIGSGVILVLDDETVIRDTIVEMLKMFGYSALPAKNGSEALDVFKRDHATERKISGMFFDLTIRGGIGGKEIIGKVRKLNKDIPVFVVSGYADDPIMADPGSYGFTASICKPFRILEIAQMLGRHIVQKQPASG
jgi:PAS domain S-box-containing protein